MPWHGERIEVETEPSSFDASLMATTMDYQLTLDKILANAEVVHGGQQIVTCRPDGSLSRCAFRDLAVRSRRRLASALIEAGLKPGDRVASLMWNNSAHLEAYYGVPMAGGILHTVNVRFHPEEIAYVIRDAESRFLIVDDVLLPLWREASSNCSLEEVIVQNFFGQRTRRSRLRGISRNRNTRCSTGVGVRAGRRYLMLHWRHDRSPKRRGLFPPRAISLHALCEMSSAAFGYGVADCVLPAVPMFHVKCMGESPYSALMSGAKLVLPGQRLDGPSLLRLASEEKVTFSGRGADSSGLIFSTV